MKFKKIFKFIAILGTSIFLVACGSWGGSININGSENGVSYNAQMTYTMAFRSAGLPAPSTGGTFDAALASIDFSSGSVDITTLSGNVTVTLTLHDSTSISNDFIWIREGQEIIFQSPSSVNSWLTTYWDNISSISASITGESESHIGNNTLIGEPAYGGVPQTSFSTAWSGGDMGGCDPVTGICYDPH